MHNEVLTKEGQALFPLLPAFDDVYLAGGTALALQIGHRVSVDFDLFSAAPIPRTLLTKVKGIFATSSVQPVINNPDELTVLVDGVKVTFLSYPFPVLRPFVPRGGIDLLSIAEIGATKAYSIGRRGTYKDYIDLYFILKGEYVSLADLIDMAEKKFGPDFNSRLFAEQLLFMDDIQDFKIEFLAPAVSRAEILGCFEEALRQITLN